MGILCIIINLYILAIFGVIILSWFPVAPDSAIGTVYNFLRRITDPVLTPVRQMLPPAGIGGMRLDLSPMIVLILLSILNGFIC